MNANIRQKIEGHKRRNAQRLDRWNLADVSRHVLAHKLAARTKEGSKAAGPFPPGPATSTPIVRIDPTGLEGASRT